MKRVLLFLLLVSPLAAKSQQFALYTTKTLVDGFENPARKLYTQDTSRQFSFNFFLPNMSLTLAAAGDGQPNLRRAISTGIYSGKNLPLGDKRMNRGFMNFNYYLAMIRVYTSVLRHGEAGLSWQLRSDTYARVTNETLAILDTYKLFDTLSVYHNPFNDHAFSQTYHQISVSYRENLTRELGVGLKLSYLSGIAYNGFDIDSSSLGVNSAGISYDLYLAGKLRSSFSYSDTASSSVLYPGFKNPGAAITVAFTYRKKYGWNVYGQLKDLGFIKWSKQSPNYNFNNSIVLANAAGNSSANLGHSLDTTITNAFTPKSFITPINSKAELMITKEYEHYRATLLASKSLFNRAGDFGLLNNFSYRSLNLGVSVVYNTIQAVQLGAMGMIKTYGFEIFGGSDQLLKSFTAARGIAKGYGAYGGGYTGASIYFGIGFNFGQVMYHPWYDNRIPGIN